MALHVLAIRGQDRQHRRQRVRWIRLDAAKLPARQEPWPSPIRFRDRIAHQSLSQLDADVLWRVSTKRVSELRAILISLRTAGSVAARPGFWRKPRLAEGGAARAVPAATGVASQNSCPSALSCGSIKERFRCSDVGRVGLEPTT